MTFTQPRTFTSDQTFGNCCLCKRPLLPGQQIERVKLTGSRNISGYKHATKKECAK